MLFYKSILNSSDCILSIIKYLLYEHIVFHKLENVYTLNFIVYFSYKIFKSNVRAYSRSKFPLLWFI